VFLFSLPPYLMKTTISTQHTTAISDMTISMLPSTIAGTLAPEAGGERKMVCEKEEEAM